MATRSSSSLELTDILSEDLFEWLSGNDATASSHAHIDREEELVNCEPEGEELNPLLNVALHEFENSQTHSVVACLKATRPLQGHLLLLCLKKIIQQAKQNAVPKSTRRDTNYCVRMWEECCHSREESAN